LKIQFGIYLACHGDDIDHRSHESRDIGKQSHWYLTIRRIDN